MTSNTASIAFMDNGVYGESRIVVIVEIPRTMNSLGTSGLVREFLARVEAEPTTFGGLMALHDARMLAASFITWFQSGGHGFPKIMHPDGYYGWALWTSPDEGVRYWPESSWEF